MATKARHLKTPVQLWIVDNRKRLGLTSLDLAKLTDVSLDTARGWESRGRPSEDALEILARRFGQPVPSESGTTPAADQAAVVAALDRQTDALIDLAKALRDAFTQADVRQQSRAEVLLGRIEAIAATVGAPAPEAGTPSGDTPSTPQTAAGEQGPRPARHRTTGAARTRPGRARPGWDELVEPLEEPRAT